MPRTRPVPGGGWRAALVAAALGAAGLSGCARTSEAVPAAPAEVRPSWPGCAATGAFGDEQTRWAGPEGPGALPADFTPVEALVCATDQRTREDGAVVRVGLERRADDIAPLLAYLARPREVSDRRDELVCPALAVEPVWLFLLDAAGRWVTPRVPTDPCGLPLDTFSEAGPAYRQLDFGAPVVTELRVEESAEARRSGCAQQWKDPLPVEADEARPAPVDPEPFAAGEVRVCRYRLAEEERSSQTPVGDLVRGQLLDRGARRTLLDALVRARPASRACDQPADRFALVRSTLQDRALYVELDGCRRILDQGPDGSTGTLAHAGRGLVRVLETLTR